MLSSFCDSGDTPANLSCELSGHLMPCTSCFYGKCKCWPIWSICLSCSVLSIIIIIIIIMQRSTRHVSVMGTTNRRRLYAQKLATLSKNVIGYSYNSILLRIKFIYTMQLIFSRDRTACKLVYLVYKLNTETAVFDCVCNTDRENQSMLIT